MKLKLNYTLYINSTNVYENPLLSIVMHEAINHMLQPKNTSRLREMIYIKVCVVSDQGRKSHNINVDTLTFSSKYSSWNESSSWEMHSCLKNNTYGSVGILCNHSPINNYKDIIHYYENISQNDIESLISDSIGNISHDIYESQHQLCYPESDTSNLEPLPSHSDFIRPILRRSVNHSTDEQYELNNRHTSIIDALNKEQYELNNRHASVTNNLNMDDINYDHVTGNMYPSREKMMDAINRERELNNRHQNTPNNLVSPEPFIQVFPENTNTQHNQVVPEPFIQVFPENTNTQHNQVVPEPVVSEPVVQDDMLNKLNNVTELCKNMNIKSLIDKVIFPDDIEATINERVKKALKQQGNSSDCSSEENDQDDVQSQQSDMSVYSDVEMQKMCDEIRKLQNVKNTIDNTVKELSDQYEIDEKNLSKFSCVIRDKEIDMKKDLDVLTEGFNMFNSEREYTYPKIFNSFFSKNTIRDWNALPSLFLAKFPVYLYLDGKNLDGETVRESLLDTDDGYRLYKLLYMALTDDDFDPPEDEDDQNIINDFMENIPPIPIFTDREILDDMKNENDRIFEEDETSQCSEDENHPEYIENTGFHGNVKK
jgi:hypothetical protein